MVAGIPRFDARCRTRRHFSMDIQVVHAGKQVIECEGIGLYPFDQEFSIDE